MPWLIAKWAMTLDGKIATSTGDSKWISNEASRQIVHALRGRVDAIMVGRNTAVADDPLLTARPVGLRRATRIVVGSTEALSTNSQLVRTVDEAPVLLAAPHVDVNEAKRLAEAGCEVFEMQGDSRPEKLRSLLLELGRRNMTNVLVEGGGALLGSLFDIDAVDEIHAFIAPIVVGGERAIGACRWAGS